MLTSVHEKSFLTKNFLLYKLNLEPKVIRLTKSLLLELSCFPKVRGKAPEGESSQFFEGIMKVLEWRLVGQISDEEFSVLYTEWLKTKGFEEVCDSFEYINIASNNQIAVYLKNFIPNKNELDARLTLMMDYLSVHFNTALICSGVPEADIDLMEELYLNFDEEGVGHIEYHKAVFLYLSILIHADEPSGMKLFTLRENYRNFMREADAFEGKITLRGFKNYFLRNGIADPETLEALKRISENLMLEFNQIYFPKTANDRKGFPDIFNVAFVAAAQSLNNVKIPNYDINHIKKTLPNLNIYYVFLVERYFILYSQFSEELQKGHVDDNFLDHIIYSLCQDFLSYFGEDFIENFHFKVQDELLKKFYLELEREFEQIFKTFLLSINKENLDIESSLYSSVHESKKLFIKLKNSKNETEEKKRRITFSNEVETAPRNYLLNHQKTSQSVLDKRKDVVQEQEKVLLNPFSNKTTVPSIPLPLMKQNSLGEKVAYFSNEKENIQNFNSKQTPIKKENRPLVSQQSSVKQVQPQQQAALNSARSIQSNSYHGQNSNPLDKLNEEVVTTFSTPWKPNNPQLQQLDREIDALFREEENTRQLPPSSIKKQAYGQQRLQQNLISTAMGYMAPQIEVDKINMAFNIVQANGDSPTTQQTFHHVRSISSTLNNKSKSNGKVNAGAVTGDDQNSFISMPTYPNTNQMDSVNNSNISDNGGRKPRDFVENNVLKVKKLYSERNGFSPSFDAINRSTNESFNGSKKTPISPIKFQNGFITEIRKNIDVLSVSGGKNDHTPNKRTQEKFNPPPLFNTEDQQYYQDVSVLENTSMNKLESKSLYEEEMNRVKNPNVRYFDMLGANHMDNPALQTQSENKNWIYASNQIANVQIRKQQSAGRPPAQIPDRKKEISIHTYSLKEAVASEDNDLRTKNKQINNNSNNNSSNHNAILNKGPVYMNNGKPPLVTQLSLNSSKENSLNVNLNLSAFQKKGSHSRNSSEFGEQASNINAQKPPLERLKYPSGIPLSEQKEKYNMEQQAKRASERKEKVEDIYKPQNQDTKIQPMNKKLVQQPNNQKSNPTSLRISDKLKNVSTSYANYKIEPFEKVIKRLNNKTLSADRVKKPFH